MCGTRPGCEELVLFVGLEQCDTGLQVGPGSHRDAVWTVIRRRTTEPA